jgi:hypothetical protein
VIDTRTRDAIVDAIEGALRDAVKASVPTTDEEWRADAQVIADAAIAALAARSAGPEPRER